MRAVAVVAIVALLAFAAAHEIPEEDNVLVLDDDNFEEAINQHDPLLVEFYAPWCGHCKKLAPEYAKAAAVLKKEGIRIAKLDATAAAETASKFDVNGYPTLKFFRAGKPTEYGGGRTETEIINWVRKKSGPPAKTINSVADLEEFKASSEVAVVGVFADGAWQAKSFNAAASSIDDVPFAITSSDAIASELGVTAPAVVLFKDFDEGRADFSAKFNEENLKSFVNGNALPLVVPFNQKNSNKIFGGPIKTHLLVFAEEGSNGYNEVLAATKEVAKTIKGRLLTVTIGKGQDRVSQYFGVTKADLPTAAIINMPEGGAMKKFLLGKNVVDQESLAGFVADYEAGSLKPHLKSEDIPADNSGPVKVVVGKNFKDIALDEGKDVLLEFYAPWCGHCKSLAPIYEELGERFASVKTVTIAKVDATANEVDHPGVNVRGFPTLIFFPANNKNSPIEYDGARDLAGLTSFLKEKASIKFTLSDEAVEADDEL